MLMTAAAALVFAVGPTLWSISPGCRSNSWSAGKGMPLSVAVRDDVTGQPIAGVTVQITPQFHPELFPPVEGTSGADGVVRLDTIGRAAGEIWTVNWEGSRPIELWKTEQVSLSGVTIQAAARGYDQARWRLVRNPGRSSVIIRLRRSSANDVGRSSQ